LQIQHNGSVVAPSVSFATGASISWMSLRSSGLRLLLLKSRISRLFGASPFAQQVMILSRVVAFQAIECAIRRLDSGDANLLFDYGDVLRGLFQTAQRFRGHWLDLSQRDRDLRKPAKLFSIARNLRNYPILYCGIASIIDRKRW
jgi:hypothetical protein